MKKNKTILLAVGIAIAMFACTKEEEFSELTHSSSGENKSQSSEFRESDYKKAILTVEERLNHQVAQNYEMVGIDSLKYFVEIVDRGGKLVISRDEQQKLFNQVNNHLRAQQRNNKISIAVDIVEFEVTNPGRIAVNVIAFNGVLKSKIINWCTFEDDLHWLDLPNGNGWTCNLQQTNKSAPGLVERFMNNCLHPQRPSIGSQIETREYWASNVNNPALFAHNSCSGLGHPLCVTKEAQKELAIKGNNLFKNSAPLDSDGRRKEIISVKIWTMFPMCSCTSCSDPNETREFWLYLVTYGKIHRTKWN
jgi:hypothetical protein